MKFTNQTHNYIFLKVTVITVLFLFVGIFPAQQAHAAGGELWAWGMGTWAILGLGDYVDRYVPTRVGADTDWASIEPSMISTYAIKTNGTLWAWGISGYSNGDGTFSELLGLVGYQGADITSPTQVAPGTTWASVATDTDGYATEAIKTDGTLWAWGNNNNYRDRLGLGYTSSLNVATPTQVGSATNWRSVSAGYYHFMGIKTDGTLWVWGDDGYGALGLGANARASTPTQVGSATNWRSVQPSYHSTVALKTDGTLWAWGANQFGQLGLGDYVDRNIPTQVGSGTNWASISAKSQFVAAIKTDGTLWTWGTNIYGELGNGDGNSNLVVSVPTKVGSDTNWVSVSGSDWPSNSVTAIKTDGTMWAWGANGRGQLGLGNPILDGYGNAVHVLTPTQVGTRTDWRGQSLRGYQDAMAITGDPTPCASAANSCGQTNSGIIVGSVCNATVPANPSGYGNACTSSANACGQTQANGTIQCNGSCSSTSPANPAYYGSACTGATSAPNICGQTNPGGAGTFGCAGTNAQSNCSGVTGTTPSNSNCSYTLTVIKVGLGYAGSMYDGGGRINCGATCSTTGTYGTSVSIAASASAGYTFTNWSGCTSTGVDPSFCGVVLTSNMTVTATFTCSTNYTWNGSACVANSRTYTCSAKPATGTNWNTVSSYTQTWNGSAWSPANSTTAYNAAADTGSCRYTCASGYDWNSSSCVAIACTSVAQCDDSNTCTTDGCTNPGAWNASCTHTNVANGTNNCSGCLRCWAPNGSTTSVCSNWDSACTDTYGFCGDPVCHSGTCGNNIYADSTVCATNSSCHSGGCTGDTRTYTCSAKPATGTSWNTVNSYSQTWNGSAWTPADSTTAYNTTANTTSCRYTCATNYLWDGSTCVLDNHCEASTSVCSTCWNNASWVNGTVSCSTACTGPSGSQICAVDNGCAATTPMGQICWNSYEWVNGTYNTPPTVSGMTAPNLDYTQASTNAKRANLQFSFVDPDNGSYGSKYRVIVKKANDTLVLDTDECTGYNLPNCKLEPAFCMTKNPTGCVNPGDCVCTYAMDSALLDYNQGYKWSVQVWDNHSAASVVKSYDTNPDYPSQADDGVVATFTTYKHEMPIAGFTHFPDQPSKGEAAKFTNTSKVYLSSAPNAAVNCTTGQCVYFWTATAGASINNSATSSPIITFNSNGNSTVTLKVTDNDGYYISVSDVINIKSQLPNWKEVKPE